MSTLNHSFDDQLAGLFGASGVASVEVSEEPDYSAVPQELKALPNWVIWGPTKAPRDAKTGRNASCDDPTTWSDFNTALSAADRIGWEILEPYVGFDFDHVIHDGVVEPFVLAILALLGNPYTEFSPSGDGLHVFVKSQLRLPVKKNSSKGYGAEIYFEKRYLTVSGKIYTGADINGHPYVATGIPEVTADVITTAHFLVSQFKNDRLKRLWLGDGSGRNAESDSSPSGLEMSLLNTLAALLKDRKKVDTFYRASLLCQRERAEQWNRLSEATLDKIFAGIQREPDYTKTSDRSASSKKLEFHLPALNAESHRDYVLSPLAGAYDGWFPRGTPSIIAGSSGSSKTTLMIQLLLAQQTKQSFLGHDSIGYSFVMLGADRGKADHKRTMESMHLDVDTVPFKALPADTFDLDAVQAIVDILEAMNPMPVIVYIEGLDLIVSEVNSIRIVSSFMRGLQEIAERYHLAIVGSLGSPKAKEGRNYSTMRDNILGSSGWGRTCATVLTMQFPNGDDTTGKRILKAAPRRAQAERFTLEFQDGVLVQIADEPENAEIENLSADIEWYQTQARLAKKDQSKEWWTILDFERALRLPHSTAERHVANDVVKNHLRLKPGKRTGAGRAKQYKWNESKTNPLWIEQQEQQTEEQRNAF